ncbi:MAG: CpsD/CapB family tyrosine-protein kinase, partial [Armatimonadetes bacterium]|nr:CpsD/CapB family tyrosine-protein kinase [Armatimonadota bacterium]
MLITTETLLGANPPRSAYLESYRVLRSSVLALHEEEPFQTVLVTSPAQGEGKTRVVANLGTMLGLVERPTIIADADFYGEGISEMFGIAGRAGLTDLCLGRAELDEVLVATEIPSLHVLSAGTQIDKGPELAITDSMRQVLGQLKDRAEFILLDCTPVSGFGTALSLAGAMDTVLVVSLARSQASVVQRCLDQLAERGANISGVIVNDVLPGDSA